MTLSHPMSLTIPHQMTQSHQMSLMITHQMI